MGRFLDLVLLLFGLQTAGVLGQQDRASDSAADIEADGPVGINVGVSASFPDAEIFGIKLVNGKPTKSLITVSNGDSDPITVQFAIGSLWTPDYDPSGSRVVRNLTHKRFGLEVPPGEKTTLPYSFQTNLHPQELRLALAAVITQDTNLYTITAFNSTVAVVDPDTSIFDPQIIFLYLFLLACVVSVGYFFYNIWIVPYLPQKKKSGGTRRAAPAKQPVTPGRVTSDSEGTATTTGSKAYNEDWIPSHHTQRPEARRVKSAAKPKNKQAKD
ncbi:hypothetical protein DV736_g4085, partial [Chaetothyriales sp. CBS 134916]